MPHDNPKRTIKQHLAIHLVLIGLSCLFILPLLWMLSTSLKPIEETMKEEIEENGPESDYPKGCYGKQPMYSQLSPHFNTHATGTAEENSEPICFASAEIAARERCTAAGGTWTNDACVTR